MALYRLTTNYANKRGQGPWLAGDVVELSPEEALWIERQAPGTLRAVYAPKRDRMVRQPVATRGENEPEAS
jgi:hypothetical protein